MDASLKQHTGVEVTEVVQAEVAYFCLASDTSKGVAKSRRAKRLPARATKHEVAASQWFPE